MKVPPMQLRGSVISLELFFYDFRYKTNLKVHSIRVMAVIEKMLHRLDNPRRSALVCDRPLSLQRPDRVKNV